MRWNPETAPEQLGKAIEEEGQAAGDGSIRFDLRWNPETAPEQLGKAIEEEGAGQRGTVSLDPI